MFYIINPHINENSDHYRLSNFGRVAIIDSNDGVIETYSHAEYNRIKNVIKIANEQKGVFWEVLSPPLPYYINYECVGKENVLYNHGEAVLRVKVVDGCIDLYDGVFQHVGTVGTLSDKGNKLDAPEADFFISMGDMSIFQMHISASNVKGGKIKARVFFDYSGNVHYVWSNVGCKSLRCPITKGMIAKWNVFFGING